MTPKKQFLVGFATGSSVALLAVIAFLLVLSHEIKKSMRHDLFTPINEMPAPKFPDAAKPFIYGTADPDWGLHTLDGREVKLGDFRGKAVFLHFWATWCGGCIDELPYLGWLEDRTRSLPVAFVLVSQEDPDKVRRFLAAFHSALPAYVTTEKPPPALSFYGLPTTYIIAPDGTVVYQYIGATRWDESSVKFLSDLATRYPRGSSRMESRTVLR